MATLEKNSPIPLYYQLYTILLNRIKMGELQPGDMLPTEVSLVEEYNVSRATVRQAILDLARNGYVVREKSKGTFVKDFSNTVGYKDRVKGFTAISSQGGTIPLTSKVLEKAVVIPPKPVREARGAGLLSAAYPLYPGRSQHVCGGLAALQNLRGDRTGALYQCLHVSDTGGKVRHHTASCRADV